jgi:hypothetical protein
MTPRNTTTADRRRQVRRARNFFLIALLAALVSLAGHCLPGDSPAADTSSTTIVTPGR